MSLAQGNNTPTRPRIEPGSPDPEGVKNDNLFPKMVDFCALWKIHRFCITAKLISAFVFATRILQSLFFLNPKFQASSHLLWLYRPVCVGPGRKPRDPFSQNEAQLCYTPYLYGDNSGPDSCFTVVVHTSDSMTTLTLSLR